MNQTNRYSPIWNSKRFRRGTLEKDMSESQKRIESVWGTFQNIQLKTKEEEINRDENLIMAAPDYSQILNQPVKASFLLSADDSNEMELQSTIGRELGFAAHHAIHHMAMVKIICTETIGLAADKDLPSDFGKAPSTIQFDSKT
jgi:hypothetical protein